jgi:hypothetical protein
MYVIFCSLDNWFCSSFLFCIIFPRDLRSLPFTDPGRTQKVQVLSTLVGIQKGKLWTVAPMQLSNGIAEQCGSHHLHSRLPWLKRMIEDGQRLLLDSGRSQSYWLTGWLASSSSDIGRSLTGIIIHQNSARGLWKMGTSEMKKNPLRSWVFPCKFVQFRQLLKKICLGNLGLQANISSFSYLQLQT